MQNAATRKRGEREGREGREEVSGKKTKTWKKGLESVWVVAIRVPNPACLWKFLREGLKEEGRHGIGK